MLNYAYKSMFTPISFLRYQSFSNGLQVVVVRSGRRVQYERPPVVVMTNWLPMFPADMYSICLESVSTLNIDNCYRVRLTN